MEPFLSNFVHNVDSKGRVSVPASFRQALASRGNRDLYAMQSITRPAIEVGGPDLLERYEAQMVAADPFGETYQDLALLAYGDGAFLKFDSEGRISVTDFIRQHTGITDKIVFVGMKHFFQLWEPARFEAQRAAARARLSAPVRKSSPE
ncbi:division/cell wall cluster transcriptional repressor MraZ [Mangrovicella endophytica]|uniref:division/cell wall cluster transcriptional repressor MraZ n=1 Tax=Mangrovicella endophytica TaxID=2066697 RepID=UPI000C9E35C2|nr:division/cell wall cluster transcriptional repressor MraZ [Mangrovicella endophytica]